MLEIRKSRKKEEKMENSDNPEYAEKWQLQQNRPGNNIDFCNIFWTYKRYIICVPNFQTTASLSSK